MICLSLRHASLVLLLSTLISAWEFSPSVVSSLPASGASSVLSWVEGLARKVTNNLPSSPIVALEVSKINSTELTASELKPLTLIEQDSLRALEQDLDNVARAAQALRGEKLEKPAYASLVHDLVVPSLEERAVSAQRQQSLLQIGIGTERSYTALRAQANAEAMAEQAARQRAAGLAQQQQFTLGPPQQLPPSTQANHMKELQQQMQEVQDAMAHVDAIASETMAELQN